MTTSTLADTTERLPKRAVFDSTFPKASTAIKAISGRKIGGYGVVFGSPMRRDREDQYFDADTDLWLDHYDNQPVFAEHTLDENGEPTEQPRKVKIGRVLKAIKDKVGVFFECLLDDTPLAEDILKRVRRGEMFWSSGAPGHLVRYENDGRIDNWPLIELSATDDPAEPKGTDIVLIKAYYKGKLTDSELEALEASPTRQTGNEPNTNPTDKTKSNRRQNMGISFKPTFAAYHQLVKQAVDMRMTAIKKAVKEMEEDPTKMDGEEDENKRKSLKEMLEEGLQSAAEDLAALSGEDPVQTMGMMVGYVMDSLSPEAQAEVEDAVEEVVDEVDAEAEAEPMVMSANKKSRRGGFSTGGYLTPQAKSVNYNRSELGSKPVTLSRFIKAVNQNDNSFLRPIQAAAIKAYKALGINPDTAGGYLVPVEQSNEIIEVLRAKAKMMELVTVLPMNSDTMDVPAQTGGATAYFVGENSQITDSQETFGNKKLVVRKQACLVKISNELLNDSSPDVDAFIRDDISKVMANKFDETIFLGSGTANVPLGLLNITGVTKTAISASSNLYEEISNLIMRVEAANVDDTDPWTHVMHPYGKKVLRNMKDSAGQYIWTGSDGIGQQSAGPLPTTLQDHPWIQTTLGGLDSNSRARHFFGNWKDLVVGMRKTIEIRASDEAGTAFEYDQTWIRAIMRWDMVLRHDESIQVLTAIQQPTS